MITRKEIDEAIQEVEEQMSNYNDCQKLATFLTLKDLLYPKYRQYIETVTETVVEYEGATEFSNIVNGKVADEVWQVIDELMEAIKWLYPRIYNQVIEKIKNIQGKDKTLLFFLSKTLTLQFFCVNIIVLFTQ